MLCAVTIPALTTFGYATHSSSSAKILPLGQVALQ
jgi:hypothetical protein